MALSQKLKEEAKALNIPYYWNYGEKKLKELILAKKPKPAAKAAKPKVTAKPKPAVKSKVATPAPKPTPPLKKEPEPETALQTINRMIKARLMEADVDIMDANGKTEMGTIKSPEFELLKQRGLKIKVSIVNNLRFPKEVEDQLVSQWKSSWLMNAKKERMRIDRQRGFIELSSQVETVLQYALSLSRDLLRQKPATQKETLKTLMLRSRDELIKNDRLHRRASMERKELERLIQWLERNGK